MFEQQPLLKHNLPIETLGGPPPPKGDPVFELKQLPDTLKYAYLDEKKICPIISANLSEHEEKRILRTVRSTMLVLDILLMILRELVPLYVSIKLICNLMLNQLLITNDD